MNNFILKINIKNLININTFVLLQLKYKQLYCHDLIQRFERNENIDKL